MGKDDLSNKKRRKLNTTTSSENIKQSPTDIYKKVVEFEETEAQLRSAEKDAVLFKKICQDVRQLFADIADLKLKGTEEAKERITAKRIEASLHLVALKKLNRLEKVRTRAGRDALHKEKQRVDSTHLLLQNLLYEADHLNKEVTKCLQFKSKDEEIELIPLEDFYKDAPTEISRPEITKTNEHQLQLARLEWELRQRRELAGACNELVASKERVAAAIAAARSRLDALSPHLRDVLKATKPLQECLALRLDEKRDETKAATLLPPPLFLLYANASAYSDALGAKNITVGISGDEDEAKRLEQLLNVESELVVSNDSDSDQENNDEDQSETKKKRHHRSIKISKEEKAEAKKKEVLKKHPLNVQVTIKNNDGTALNLIFSYMLHLKIVVVKFTMNFSKPVTGVSAADVLNGDCILKELYIGDTGDDSPHPATAYLLNAAGISEEFRHFIPEVGKPYIWAQRMCGLDFMVVATDTQKSNKNLQPCQSLSVASVENFIFTLKKRLKARIDLMKELQDLESGKILPAKGSEKDCPVRLSGSLTQWQSVGWQEYSQALSTSFFISEGLVTADKMLQSDWVDNMARKKVYPPPGTRKYGTKSRYSKEDLEKALDDIKNCRKTQKGAAEVYNIPVSTLKYKLKEQHSKPVGKPPVLSSEEEDSITAHIISLADLGIPVSMLDVRVIVKGFLDNEKRLIKEFKNNLPGWEWGKLFLERHPDIKPKVAHAISRKRAQVTQEMVQNYFDYLHKELQDVPPSNIFNFDETGFHDNPKKQTLLFRRSCKNPEIILNSTKSCYTVMFCCNATGEFVPLYIIFKAKQKWTSWIQGAPAGTRMAVTKSGWIDAATFEDWFEEQLLPVLQQKEGKKVLLGDNLSSHITPKTLRLCHENNIAFVCLIPNSTHLLQPLDVSYFSSLKSNWRKVLVNWRKTRRGKVANALPKEVFSKLLTETLKAGDDTAANNAIAGFKACGIHPFNPAVVLEKLRNYSKSIEEVRQAVGESFKQYINEIREADLKPKLIKKFQLPVVAGKSVSVEAVEKYYQERETIAKSKANKRTSNSGVGSIPGPVKKRGRPVGAKNKAAKKVVTSIVDKPTSTSSTIPGPSSPIPTAGPSGMCMATSKDVNHDTILEFPDLSSDSILMDPIPPSISPSLCNAGVVQYEQINPPSPIEVVEIHSCNIEDIEGNYQNHDGILERVDLNEKNDANIGSVFTDKGASKVSWGKENRKQDYCVVKYEDILFPGRIICREGDTVKISVMQKSQDGWKWPLKRDLITCQQQNIVSFLDDQKIIKLKDYYLVDDPQLFMEWGD